MNTKMTIVMKHISISTLPTKVSHVQQLFVFDYWIPNQYLRAKARHYIGFHKKNNNVRVSDKTFEFFAYIAQWERQSISLIL